jgi:PPOX class probable F420-dependent enzyme
MPLMPLPSELARLVAQPNPAVIGTVRPDGSPHTAATWYDWEDGRILLNMDESRARLGHMRENPRVSITILVEGDAADQVTLLGRVESIEPDDDLRDIDRLALRYTGKPFRTRDRRRVSAWLRPERWSSWPLPPAVASTARTPNTAGGFVSPARGDEFGGGGESHL